MILYLLPVSENYSFLIGMVPISSAPATSTATTPTTRTALDKAIGQSRALGNRIAAARKKCAASGEKVASLRRELEEEEYD